MYLSTQCKYRSEIFSLSLCSSNIRCDIALSKNATVANCLNSVRTSNVESAATEAQWMALLSDYFGDGVSESDDSVSSNESDTDISDIVSDTNDDSQEDVGVIDEAAAVMETVDDVDEDDIAAEQRKVQKFSCVNKSSKYSCHLHDDAPCFSAFTEEFVLNLRMDMSALPAYEKDLIILGKISSTIRNAPMTEKSKRKQQTARQQQRTNYCVEGQRVCRETFRFLHW